MGVTESTAEVARTLVAWQGPKDARLERRWPQLVRHADAARMGVLYAAFASHKSKIILDEKIVKRFSLTEVVLAIRCDSPKKTSPIRDTLRRSLVATSYAIEHYGPPNLMRQIWESCGAILVPPPNTRQAGLWIPGQEDGPIRF